MFLILIQLMIVLSQHYGFTKAKQSKAKQSTIRCRFGPSSLGSTPATDEITWMTAVSRSAALQPQNFAAPLINDRFSRGIAAVAGCVPRPKDGLCKLRFAHC
ncbi:hypothetical protein [Pseudophaeobacter profundi]|uniref:hypothetical protein n=1 Tax=Pseudophaeobacter profundi TaxID=3034152 RepID=UPI00242FA7D0|nr:hypothetical protein [Pseudophaeobacter profundi]